MSNPAGGGARTSEPVIDDAGRARRRRLWWYLLFVVQFVAVCWPPFYNKAEPHLAGIPFFYWYQLLCLVIGGVLTAIVYFATEKSRRNPGNR
jgi:uncharacterized membrane protein YhaH (DUF805 family)